MKLKVRSPEWYAVQAAKQNVRYYRRKRWIDKIKLRCGCVECGYNAHPAALDFDHINPADKEFLIPRYVANGNLQRLFREIRKCRVICANCHRIHSRAQWADGSTKKPRGPYVALQC